MSSSAQFYWILGVLLLTGAWTYYLTLKRGRRGGAAQGAPLAVDHVRVAEGGERPKKRQPILTYVGVLVLLLSIPLLTPWCNSWYWARHPPTQEHRQELVETVSRQFQCPADQLEITPHGEIGAFVVGCGASTRLCWRKLAHLVLPSRVWLGPSAWLPCE